jgi:hypothetical protein
MVGGDMEVTRYDAGETEYDKDKCGSCVPMFKTRAKRHAHIIYVSIRGHNTRYKNKLTSMG